MTIRQKLASDVSPVLLRVVLGVTFAYMAMWGFEQGEFSGSRAAVLARVGVIDVPMTPTVQRLVEEVPDVSSDDGLSQPAMDEQPSDEDEVVPPADEGDQQLDDVLDEVAEVQPAGATAGGEPAEEEQSGEEALESEEPGEVTPMLLENDSITAIPDEMLFPDPIPARRLHGVTVLLYESAHAGPSGGRLPGWFGTGRVPVIGAYVVAGASALGAVLLVLGFLTRLASLVLCVVMVGSIWLLEISPVVVGGAPGLLGVLPAHEEFSIRAWSDLLWQLVLLGGVFSVFCSGAGWLSLDRFLMGSGSGRSGVPRRKMPPLEAPEPTRPI